MGWTGLTSGNSFTLRFKNLTSYPQSMNLFAQGVQNETTFKTDGFYQDGSSATLDIGIGVEKEVVGVDGAIDYLLKPATVNVEIREGGVNTSYLVNTLGTLTLKDVAENLSNQSGVLINFTPVSEFVGGVLDITSFYVTNATTEFCVYVYFKVAATTLTMGVLGGTTPIGLTPVSSPNTSSSMVTISGTDYSSIKQAQGVEPMANISIKTSSSNATQLLKCVTFTRSDVNGNLAQSVECPTIDPYQFSNSVYNVQNTDIVFDGNTSMEYLMEGDTSASLTFSYSQVQLSAELSGGSGITATPQDAMAVYNSSKYAREIIIDERTLKEIESIEAISEGYEDFTKPMVSENRLGKIVLVAVLVGGVYYYMKNN